jgi:hypothetical protein
MREPNRSGHWLCAALVSLTCACGGDDPGGSPKNNGGAQGQGAQAGTLSGAGTGVGGGAGQAQSMGGSSAGMDGPLLNGAGREYRGIVNLVDAEAAKALDDYLLDADPYEGGSGELSLELATRLFYQHYPDEYDFIYFMTAHGLDTPVSGLHGWVTKPLMLGTGADAPICSGDGPAHLLSAIGIQVPNLDDFPPFAHEYAHHFAVHLAKEFGFSRDVDTVFQAHWGMTSANGQLGGFDATTLACEMPAGAKPPNCTASAGGRYRYVVAPFRPNGYLKVEQPFGPLELYMMGLLPVAEVPSPIVRFDGADYPFDALEVTADGKLVIDATGVTEIKMSDIVARHGEVPARPADKRHFKAAVVVVSATPAAQPLLDRVADWAAIFGGEMPSGRPDWVSFAQLTGNRASMSCRVGARHELGPDDVLEFACPSYNECSPQTQNCPQGLACYGTSDLYCAQPGVLENGASCEQDDDCKVGSVCAPIPTDFPRGVCSPYCDQVNASAPNACATLCPTSFSPIYNVETLEELGAFCFGGAGGACDPLLQDCGPGQACTGVDAVGCELAGTSKLGEVCLPFGASCEKGSVCVGIQGAENQYCQPYCDLAPGAPAATACASKCPKGVWEYPGYGICIPG